MPEAPNVGRQLHGEITTRPIPLHDVLTDSGAVYSPGSVRGRRQVALLMAHESGCLACYDYARQMAGIAAALDEADADALIVVPGIARDAAAWRHGLPVGARLLADPEGRWKHAVAGHVEIDPSGVLLVLLDRYLAPRVVSAAAEAGGLADPSDAVDWLRYLALECPECSGELAWPEAAAGVP